MAQRIKIQDGIVVYQSADSTADIDFYINGYLHVSKGITAATLGVSGATTLALTTVNGPSTFNAPTTHNAPVTITAPLTGATASFSGSVSASSLTASGTVSGATAVISGSVNADAGIFGTSVTSPVFIGNFSGNASTATSLAGGTTGAVVYQSAPSTTAFLPAGTTNQVLISGASAPSWTSSPSGLTSVTATTFNGAFSGNSTTATTLETPRSISTTGDATWTVTFDGSANVTNPITLATVNSSPQTDTFRKVTVNGKGLVTATSAVTNSDITTTLGYTPVNKAGDTMSGFLVLNAAPVTALGAVTKQYVDDIASGLTIHAACITSTNGSDLSATYNNGAAGVGATLTGVGALPSIGGITPVVGNRVLVKDQTAQLQNGIYVVTQATANWILTRTTDFDGSPATEIQAGDAVYVQQGTLAGTQWVQTTAGTITVGVTSIVFSQFGGPGTYTAGTGINIAGTSISNTGVLSNIAGTGISVSGATGNVTIGNTGVLSLAGTANQITSSASTGNITLSLPSSVTIGGTMTAGTFSGSGALLTNIPNSALTNSSITIGSTSIALGGTSTTLSGLSTVTATTFSGNATSANVATAAIALQNSRTIAISGDATWNVNFNGSVNVTNPITFATVNSNVGTFNNVTVNGKGLVTAASNVAYITGNQTITVSGDASGSGTTAIGLTLATVNGNVGTFNYPTLAVNGKGLITSISSNTPVTSLAGTANQVSVSAATGAVTVSLPSSVTISGTMTAGVFNSTSTKRVKKKIKTLGKSYLTRFADLKPREYDRRDYQAHEFGFIAEEMQEVYPEVVGIDADGKASGIDYGKLATILTAKVQEQEKTIELLQKQMQEVLALVKGSK